MSKCYLSLLVANRKYVIDIMVEKNFGSNLAKFMSAVGKRTI